MAESTYRVLQHQPPVALSRFDVDERDKLRFLAKDDFCRYYHNIYQHTIIEFYMAARAHDSKLRYGTKSSKGNNKNLSNGGGPRASAQSLSVRRPSTTQRTSLKYLTVLTSATTFFVVCGVSWFTCSISNYSAV